MSRPASEAGGPWPPACVTLPSLADGNVGFILGTIFIEQVDAATPVAALTPEQYREGDIDGARRRGRAQLEVYETWRDRGWIRIDMPACLRTDAGVGTVRGGMGVSELQPPSLSSRVAKLNGGPPHVGILIEGADPVWSPEELPWWKSRGVVAIGMAWARSSRYAQGNMGLPVTGQDTAVGVSPLGRQLIREMDALDLVHDLSHLSDRATDDLLSLTDRPVIASHSNCRSLLGGDLEGRNQRHLRDETVIEIGRRRGVIGLNLFARFLRQEPPHKDEGRPTIDHAVAHIERVCELMGHRRGVGLGSDMDGGFGAMSMCDGIESPTHLGRLADALQARGWSSDEVFGFMVGNWAEFWSGR